MQRVAEGLCGLSGPIFGPEQQAGRAELGLPTVSWCGERAVGLARQKRAWAGWNGRRGMQSLNYPGPVRAMCCMCSSMQTCSCSCCSSRCSQTAAAPCIVALPQGPNLRQQHLHAMLQLVLPWVTPARAAIEAARQSAAGGEERLLSACRCLLAAARVHRSAGFDAASAALGLPAGSGGLLGLLSELTTAVLAAAGSDPGWWETEASELLLETWVELVADPCRGPMGGSQASVAAAAAVFAAVVEAGLQQAAAEAQEDEGGLRGCAGLCLVHGWGGMWAGEWVEQSDVR